MMNNIQIQIGKIDPLLLPEIIKYQEEIKEFLIAGLFSENGNWEICRKNGVLQEIVKLKEKKYERKNR